MSRFAAAQPNPFQITAYDEKELSTYFSSMLEDAWKSRRNMKDYHGSIVKEGRSGRSSLNEIIAIDIHPATSFAAWSRADGGLSVMRPSIRSEKLREHSLIGSIKKNIHGEGKIVYSISWNPNESQFATVGNTSSVKIWNVVDNSLRLLKEFKTNFKAKNFITLYAPSGKYLLVVTKSDELYLFDVDRGYELYLTHLSEANDPIHSVCWSNDSLKIFAGYKSGFVRVFSLKSESILLVVEKRNHMKTVSSLNVDPMGRALIVGSRDDCSLWSLPHLTPSKSPLYTEDHIRSIGISFDGSIISITSSKKESDICLINFYWYNDLSLMYSASFRECSCPLVQWSNSSNIYFATSTLDRVAFADITIANSKTADEHNKGDPRRDLDKSNKAQRNNTSKNSIRDRELRFARKREIDSFNGKSEFGRSNVGFRSANERW